MNSPRRLSTFVQTVAALGFACLLTLTVLVPLHQIVAAAGYTYYREFLSGMIAAATLVLWASRAGDKPTRNRMSLYILAGILFVAAMSLVDPGQKLYPGTDETQISDHLTSTNQTLYVFRNYVLYLPVYAFLSGSLLSSRQFKLLAWVISCMGPVAIIGYVEFYGDVSLDTLGSLATIGAQFFAYNSFVPHLTFSVLAALFLLFDTNSQLHRVFLMAIIVVVTVYVFVSTSRQGMSFVVLVLLTYFIVNQKLRTLSMYCLVLGLVFAMFFGARYFLSQQGVDEMLVSRSGLSGYTDTTGRPEAAIDGLSLLTPSQWITGAGLTAVINSGPHNDYVRWLQRIGIFGMIVTFLPFLYAFKRSAANMIKARSPLSTFVCLGVTYTLVQSLFGYPREDAYQAMYCWIGLGIFTAFCSQTETMKASRTAPRRREALKRELVAAAVSEGGVRR